jgi:hypothetical protein
MTMIVRSINDELSISARTGKMECGHMPLATSTAAAAFHDAAGILMLA